MNNNNDIILHVNNELLTKPATQIERRIAILALEDAMCAKGYAVVDPNKVDDLTPMKHYFAPGVYIREMIIPKDTFLVGALHITQHQLIMPYGSIIVWNEFGVNHWQGYNNFTSLIGEKRVGYALEDTMWMAVHEIPENMKDCKDPDEMLKTFARFSNEDNELYKEYIAIEDKIPSINSNYSLSYNNNIVI